MSMKDLLSKMTELQGTVESVKVAPVTATGKKVLNESSNTMKESTKPSLKSIFSSLLSEAEQVTIQPAKQNTQVIKQGQKTLGTVENPQLAQQIKQSIGKGEMSLAGDELQEDDMAEGLDPAQKQKLKSLIYAYRDATDPFGSEYDLDPSVVIDRIRQEFGDKIADTISQGPSMHFPRPGHVSGVYDPLANKSSPRVTKLGKINRQDAETMKRNIKQQQGMTESKLTEKAVSKVQQQAAGAALAAKRGDAPKSKLTGASKEMAKMSTKELEKFAGTKHKGLPDKKEKTDESSSGVRIVHNKLLGGWFIVRGPHQTPISGKFSSKEEAQQSLKQKEKPTANEAAMPTHDGDFGAGLGAGRNSKTLESKKSKPDFLDKDGNKKESMKKAAADDKQKVSTMKKTNDVKKTGKLRESIDVELGTPEHKVIMDLINGNLDAYDVMNHPRTPAQKNVADMMQDRYDDIATEYPLHADDDFEDILYKLVDELADDYDTQGYSQSMNEAKKAKPDFLDIDGDGDEKESMKKAQADKKKTGSADKKSSAGLTAAQKKLPAGLQKAAADAKKKKVAIKENITAKYGYGPQMHDQIINATPSQLRRMAYNMADGPGYQRISHEIDQLMKAQAELRQEAGLPLVVDEPEEAPIPSKPSLGQRFKSFVGLKEGSDSETVNEISTDLKQRARDKATDLANIAGDKNHHMAQKVRTDQADKFQAGMEKDFKKNRRNAERDSLSPAQRRKLGMMEGANPTEAARLLGKAHAMGKDPFACKYEEGSSEAQAYLDGYKEGLDECYGSGGGMGMAQDMSQDIGMMPGMDSMVSMNDTPSPRGGSDFEVDSMDDMGSFGGFDSQSDEFMEADSDWDAEFDAKPKDWKPTPNQAFDASKRALGIANRLPKDQRDKWNSRTMSQMNKFRVGKTEDMMAFEAWDRQLNELLNEGKMKDIDIDMKQMSDAEFKKEHGKSKADMKKDLSGDSKKPVKEGISVSVSKGQQGAPDSVSVTAQDSDADALLAMIKQAGLGLFGGDEPSGYGSPAVAATQPIGDIGDHDSMMALIKKMSSTGNDYEDEESMSCDSCDDESDSKALVVGEEQGYDDKEDESLGMRTGKESDKEQSMKDRRDDSYGKFGKRTDEDETEDQMEFEVAESNAPDSGEAETTADENAEAKEDQALAGADSGDEEEIDEGSCSMDEEEELTEWANDAGYTGSENIKDNTFEQDIEFMTRIISGGLNGPKKDQTTLPHTRVKVEESRQVINEWKKLSGIK